MYSIDLNCDMGEGTGNDALLMPYISSCSIACGGHYGTKQSIAATATLAKAQGVRIGAHPAYPDPENFGRKSMDLSHGSLQDALRRQLDTFFSVCTVVNHIKPHGALYNDLFFDREKAAAVVAVFSEYAPGIKVYCAPGSQLATVAAEQGFSVRLEAFADRAYASDGTLVARTKKNAVLIEKQHMAQQLIQIIKSETVTSITGEIIPMKAQTICLHGDGVGVVENAAFLVESLKQNRISVEGL